MASTALKTKRSMNIVGLTRAEADALGLALASLRLAPCASHRSYGEDLSYNLQFDVPGPWQFVEL